MQKKTLVTSALLYANGPLHLGHLVEYIQTDIFVRYLRLKGKDVIYCCADDTHGAPIEINAKKQGISPKALIKKAFDEHIKDFKSFNISFDEYYTTDSPENRHYADKMFKISKENGYITKKYVKQLYCKECDRFLPDRYILGQCPKCGSEDQYGDVCEKCGSAHKPTELISPRCAICSSLPVEKTSSHYFFKLSKFSERLEGWLKSNPYLQKEMVNSVKQWIKDGLQDWDISRDGPYFGFNIPGEDNLYYYVWWDAPIGYIAASEHYCQANGLGDAEKNYWKNDDAEIIHFIGKDIIYFHFLFWPAVLMACGYNLPKWLNVHGFLTIDGEKMSKSRGTFITAESYASRHNPEYLRYYYARMLSRKLADVDYSEDEFASKINNELVANIGNLCYRLISFSNNHFEGRISSFADEKKLKDEIGKKISLATDAYDDLNFKQALSLILEISAAANKYFQDNAPWKLIKDDKEKVEEVLGFCLEIAKNICVLIKPVMPVFAEKLEKQLGLGPLSLSDLGFASEGYSLGESKILLEKIEIASKDVKKEERSGKKPAAKKADKMPFNLVVGKILGVEDHPDAEKLYIIQVDIGSEKRQIIAGLKPFIPREDMLGKKIVLVKNLEYAKLRGKESQGMLLAADHTDAEGKQTVKMVQPRISMPGDRVYIEGFEDSEKIISFKDFMQNKLVVTDSKVILCSRPIKTDKETIQIEMPDDSAVR